MFVLQNSDLTKEWPRIYQQTDRHTHTDTHTDKYDLKVRHSILRTVTNSFTLRARNYFGGVWKTWTNLKQDTGSSAYDAICFQTPPFEDLLPQTPRVTFQYLKNYCGSRSYWSSIKTRCDRKLDHTKSCYSHIDLAASIVGYVVSVLVASPYDIYVQFVITNSKQKEAYMTIIKIVRMLLRAFSKHIPTLF